MSTSFEYPMEQKYEDLRFLSRQYEQCISYVAKLKVQLIDLLDQTMLGITKILQLNSRNPEPDDIEIADTVTVIWEIG